MSDIVDRLNNTRNPGARVLCAEAAKEIEALSSKNEEQALVIRELVAAIEEGAQVNTPDLMEWVAERLIFVHDESPHVDYVLSLRRRAEKLRKASEFARAAIAKAKP